MALVNTELVKLVKQEINGNLQFPSFLARPQRVQKFLCGLSIHCRAPGLLTAIKAI